MKPPARSVAAIALAGIWVSASEFLRNQVLVRAKWVEHYQSLGLVFPSAPSNAVIWVLWAFLLASMIFAISRRFSLIQTTLLSWTLAFVMMWLVTWNLRALPAAILGYAVPLSLLESFVGSYICKRMSPR